MSEAFVVHESPAGRPLAATVNGLLPQHELDALLAATLHEERWFVEASTEGGPSHRSAAVLYTVVDEAIGVVDRVCAWARRAATAFGLGLPVAPRVEHQITAYRAGDHYGPHRDDQGQDPAGRQLTYVFYYHRLPRRFRGGELVIQPAAGEPLSLAPALNQVVFFPSAELHEVHPVTGPASFADARFTINGWLWR